MADNKYANLVGTNKIKDEFTKINTGFAGVEADIDAEVAAREQTDADLATLDGRVATIIQGGGPDKDAELVDIRTPDESYTPVATIDVAGDMTRDMQAQFMSHKADTTPHATIQSINKLGMSSASVVTIASGAITVTKSFHTVDTEGGASSDDLSTINGGSDGDVLILGQRLSSRVVTIKGDGTGNIFTFDRSNIVMMTNTSLAILINVGGTSWYVVGIQGVKRSGDTMTGDLIFSGARSIRQDAADAQIQFSGGSASNLGANMILYGQSHATLAGTAKFRSGSTDNWALSSAGVITLRNGTTHGEVTGSPEGSVTAPVGSTRTRTDGSTTTTLYVKTSGTGNTGWTAK